MTAKVDAHARAYADQLAGGTSTAACGVHFPVATGEESVWKALVGLPAHTAEAKQEPEATGVVSQLVAQPAAAEVVMVTEAQTITGGSHVQPQVGADACNPSMPSNVVLESAGQAGGAAAPR